MNTDPHSEKSLPTITVWVRSAQAPPATYRFSKPFCIGRGSDCQVQLVDDVVSRRHLQISFVDHQWWLQDLGSANGTYVADRVVTRMVLAGSVTVRLGAGGPVVEMEVQALVPPEQKLPERTVTQKSDLSINQVKKHYFGQHSDENSGEHTLMVRRAYAEVRTKQRRVYISIIAAIGLLLVVTGSVAWYKHAQLQKQRALAEEIFYAMRSLEIELVKLRVEAEQQRSEGVVRRMDEFKTQQQQLERNYGQYVDSLNIYGQGKNEQERLIMRMAHRLGECEINMPDGFVQEVSAYIDKWKSSQRLAHAIRRAMDRGYIADIVQALSDHDLPSQFFYLALQESNLDTKACGPPTRFGIAKGMWQFIPATAERYGLKLGPLKEEAQVDPLDDRHNFTRSTLAAAGYLRDIYTTDAQASGLLVMASYNWGEERVIKLIQSLPLNPKDRNFWQLMTRYRHKIPDETYDYVFYIFSAAVIGENPRLFGFDFDNPLG